MSQGAGTALRVTGSFPLVPNLTSASAAGCLRFGFGADSKRSPLSSPSVLTVSYSPLEGSVPEGQVRHSQGAIDRSMALLMVMQLRGG